MFVFSGFPVLILEGDTRVTYVASAADDPERSVDLLRRAQAGDEQARDELLARYLPRLERWASGRLPLSVRSKARVCTMLECR